MKILVCDNSYHVAGKSDTLEMLVKVIEEKLFLKNNLSN